MAKLKDFGVDVEAENYDEIAAYGVALVYNLIEKEITSYLREHHLTPAKFNAMLVIKHVGRDAGISQIDIGKRLIVSASNMTRLIDNLIREGYVKKIKAAGDRRVNLIKITKKGRNALDSAWPGYRQRIRELCGHLNKQEQKALGKILLGWSKKLQA